MDRDVVIVGAGVVGTAIARELTGFGLDVTLLEAAPDVGAGTSKAPTPPCCTPASMPSPGRWRRGSFRAGTSC
jgi:glycine/D-amino acid oxidase-like deaminating enzyme